MFGTFSLYEAVLDKNTPPGKAPVPDVCLGCSCCRQNRFPDF